MINHRQNDQQEIDIIITTLIDNPLHLQPIIIDSLNSSKSVLGKVSRLPKSMNAVIEAVVLGQGLPIYQAIKRIQAQINKKNWLTWLVSREGGLPLLLNTLGKVDASKIRSVGQKIRPELWQNFLATILPEQAKKEELTFLLKDCLSGLTESENLTEDQAFICQQAWQNIILALRQMVTIHSTTDPKQQEQDQQDQKQEKKAAHSLLARNFLLFMAPGNPNRFWRSQLKNLLFSWPKLIVGLSQYYGKQFGQENQKQNLLQSLVNSELLVYFANVAEVLSHRTTDIQKIIENNNETVYQKSQALLEMVIPNPKVQTIIKFLEEHINIQDSSQEELNNNNLMKYLRPYLIVDNENTSTEILAQFSALIKSFLHTFHSFPLDTESGLEVMLLHGVAKLQKNPIKPILNLVSQNKAKQHFINFLQQFEEPLLWQKLQLACQELHYIFTSHNNASTLKKLIINPDILVDYQGKQQNAKLLVAVQQLIHQIFENQKIQELIAAYSLEPIYNIPHVKSSVTRIFQKIDKEAPFQDYHQFLTLLKNSPGTYIIIKNISLYHLCSYIHYNIIPFLHKKKTSASLFLSKEGRSHILSLLKKPEFIQLFLDLDNHYLLKICKDSAFIKRYIDKLLHTTEELNFEQSNVFLAHLIHFVKDLLSTFNEENHALLEKLSMSLGDITNLTNLIDNLIANSSQRTDIENTISGTLTRNHLTLKTTNQYQNTALRRLHSGLQLIYLLRSSRILSSLLQTKVNTANKLVELTLSTTKLKKHLAVTLGLDLSESQTETVHYLLQQLLLNCLPILRALFSPDDKDDDFYIISDLVLEIQSNLPDRLGTNLLQQKKFREIILNCLLANKEHRNGYGCIDSLAFKNLVHNSPKLQKQLTELFSPTQGNVEFNIDLGQLVATAVDLCKYLISHFEDDTVREIIKLNNCLGNEINSDERNENFIRNLVDFLLNPKINDLILPEDPKTWETIKMIYLSFIWNNPRLRTILDPLHINQLDITMLLDNIYRMRSRELNEIFEYLRNNPAILLKQDHASFLKLLETIISELDHDCLRRFLIKFLKFIDINIKSNKQKITSETITNYASFADSFYIKYLLLNLSIDDMPGQTHAGQWHDLKSAYKQYLMRQPKVKEILTELGVGLDELDIFFDLLRENSGERYSQLLSFIKVNPEACTKPDFLQGYKIFGMVCKLLGFVNILQFLAKYLINTFKKMAEILILCIVWLYHRLVLEYQQLVSKNDDKSTPFYVPDLESNSIKTTSVTTTPVLQRWSDIRREINSAKTTPCASPRRTTATFKPDS